jgi:hypothetical protein
LKSNNASFHAGSKKNSEFGDEVAFEMNDDDDEEDVYHHGGGNNNVNNIELHAVHLMIVWRTI